ncbi:MAG: hypothetical protein U9R79_21640 [Armatimonadota bacterium]|nr:hypothetical protein [Armatimonadota bacterium]
MGTSTWHRSPDTEAWRRVRELYAQPDPSPPEVARRIVQALEPQTRSGMCDSAVVTCLGRVVEGSQSVAAYGLEATLRRLGVGAEPAAVQMAAGLRTRAEELIARQGLASRFGDLALEAVGTSALAIATLTTTGAGVMELPLAAAEANFARFDREGELHDVAALFVGHDLDRTFRYFVSRDVSDFVGGEGLPTVSHASRLEDAVAAHCRDTWRQLELSEHEGLLSQTLGTAPDERAEMLRPVVADATAQGLDVLGSGGT